MINRGNKIGSKIGNKIIATTVQIAAITPITKAPVQVKINNNKILSEKKNTDATKNPQTLKPITAAPVNKVSAICPPIISSKRINNAIASDRNMNSSFV
jgi:hypothetical protein